MILITSKIPISSRLTLLSSPSIAFFASLIKTMSTGIITGKLRIAISIPPFPALLAIAEIMVKIVEKLVENFRICFSDLFLYCWFVVGGTPFTDLARDHKKPVFPCANVVRDAYPVLYFGFL